MAACTSTPDGGRSSAEVRTDQRLTLEGVNGVVGLVGVGQGGRDQLPGQERESIY